MKLLDNFSLTNWHFNFIYILCELCLQLGTEFFLQLQFSIHSSLFFLSTDVHGAFFVHIWWLYQGCQHHVQQLPGVWYWLVSMSNSFHSDTQFQALFIILSIIVWCTYHGITNFKLYVWLNLKPYLPIAPRSQIPCINLLTTFTPE